jgi:LPXTG-motif cell wall-anchored protein
MNQKMIYFFSLVCFFLLWGLFGFVAAAPRSAPDLPATVPPVQTIPVIPEVTETVGIPVTGESEPVWIEIMGFYGLIGLAALFLILALLNFASKSTALYPKSKGPTSEETHKH